MADEEVTGTGEQEKVKQLFVLQRIYVKDMSFESPRPLPFS
jgi:preprotein translocase subunit SecB